MPPSDSTLWRNPGFVRLWVAQSVSSFGNEITAIALPLTAVLTLGAGATEMGLLRAVHAASGMIFALVAGVLVDRWSRKTLLIATDVTFALIAASVPLAAVIGVLGMGQLFVVQAVSGAVAMLALVGAQSFLQFIVGRDGLVSAHSKVQTTVSAAAIVGPGLGGALVELLTAPIALALDAISFAVSALLLTGIPEAVSPPPQTRGRVWSDMLEGVRHVFRNPILRPMSHAIAIHFAFAAILTSMLVLYVTRDLGLRPLLVGVILGGMGPGMLIGSLAAPALARRFGIGRAAVAGSIVNVLGAVLIPGAGGSELRATVMLTAGHVLLGIGIQISGIGLVSLRQALTPDEVQGRMTATFRLMNLAAAALGALLATMLATMLELRTVLAVGAAGMIVPPLRLLLSPLARVVDVRAAVRQYGSGSPEETAVR